MRSAVVVFLVLVGALVLVWVLGPRVMATRVLPVVTVPDIAGHVARRNAVAGLREGDGDVLVWDGARAPWAVVYLHGFSSSPAELRPVPQEVAAALGANLYIPRLTGHGLSEGGLVDVSAEAWLQDTAEALAIGRAMGERVLVIATSTGGTLATIALADPVQAEGVAGVVLVAPNYGVAGWGGWLLDLPWIETWGPLVAGEVRSFVPLNAGQAAHWTTTYPTRAALPVAALVRTARGLDHAAIRVPALVVYAMGDTVVDATRTPPVMARWGGPVTSLVVTPGPGCDPMQHLIAGEIMCPEGTAPTVAAVLEFAAGLD